VDTGRWLPASAAVSAAATALARSEAEFLDVTDAWSGRYLVLYAGTTGTRVMTDATGMRSAFYTLDGPFLLSSHAPLVAHTVQAEASVVNDAFQAVRHAMGGRWLLPMPGRSTPWKGVVALTPNMTLGVPGRDLRRMFPRAAVRTMDARTAASTIGPRLRGQVERLVASDRPVCLSVTAGRDSRVSLAASRSFRDSITYFTYVRAGLERTSWDISVARRTARRYELSHRILTFGSTALEPGLEEALAEATILRHGPQLVAAYRDSFPSDAIHIRSNLGEIGRAFLRSKPWAASEVERDPRLTPESVARVWGYGTLPPQPIIDAFEEWMLAVGFGEVEEMDPLDVLFWEHRLACWHSNVVLESDFAFDTHVLFNARRIYRDLLSVPLDDRTDGRVFELLVADMWPDLMRFPHVRPKRGATASPPPYGARRVTLGRRLGRCVGRRYAERVRRGR
jgi:hypothetical protein